MLVYTHTNKENKLNNYYIPHHHNLDDIKIKLSTDSSNLLIIDCHSFSKDIIMFEDRKDNIPDICIGFNDECGKIVALIIK